MAGAKDKLSTSEADRLAREAVAKHFALPEGADERGVRMRIADLIFRAGVVGQVAESARMARGWGQDFTAEVADRLTEALVSDVLGKLDLGRVATSSVCGWARKLLHMQAVWTLRRSEERSRRAVPREDLEAAPAGRPGVRKPARHAHRDDVDALEARLDLDMVETARRACGSKNEVHLQEYFLRRHFGLQASPRLALGNFAGLGLAGAWLSEEDRRFLPPKVTATLERSATTARHEPSKAVLAEFFYLVESWLGEENEPVQVARAWLDQWAEAARSGAPKAPAMHDQEVATWRKVAEAAILNRSAPTSDVDELDRALERLFWEAHDRVGATRCKRARAA